MGLELELSELAVIRPIRTAPTRADGATPTLLPGSGGKDDAADTGCVVTPTAAVSPMHRQSGADLLDAGCVTPTAAASPVHRRRRSGVDLDAGCDTPTALTTAVLLQGYVVDAEDNTGCVVTPTAAAAGSPTTPRRAGVAFVVDAGYVTPTSAASLLRPSTDCPPAPRKPARSPVAPKRKRCCGGGGPAPQRCFFPVPRDLTKVFVARGPPESSPPSQAAKKIRVHPVG